MKSFGDCDGGEDDRCGFGANLCCDDDDDDYGGGEWSTGCWPRLNPGDDATCLRSFWCFSLACLLTGFQSSYSLSS